MCRGHALSSAAGPGRRPGARAITGRAYLEGRARTSPASLHSTTWTAAPALCISTSCRQSPNEATPTNRHESDRDPLPGFVTQRRVQGNPQMPGGRCGPAPVAPGNAHIRLIGSLVGPMADVIAPWCSRRDPGLLSGAGQALLASSTHMSVRTAPGRPGQLALEDLAGVGEPARRIPPQPANG